MSLRAAPTPAASLDGTDVVVDAAYVAPRLGLDPEAFRLALRHGAVVGTVEAGHGEDAGRTRVTLRRGDRVWRAILEADGRLVDEA